MQTTEYIPEYQVWVREYRGDISPSPEGEQGFEDIEITIRIRHFCLVTIVVMPEIWAQMASIIQYLNNVFFLLIYSLQRLIFIDYELADRLYFRRSKAQANANITDSSIPDGLRLITIPRDRKVKTTTVIYVGSLRILKSGFVHGRGFGVKLDGILEPVQLSWQNSTFGLRYEPTLEELSSANIKRKYGILLSKPVLLLN
ncbi:hypothetical protein BC332_30496 [Capsicum chinense]|nr:hypothetical protein BC332_30496 [Capsicum chinense]